MPGLIANDFANSIRFGANKVAEDAKVFLSGRVQIEDEKERTEEIYDLKEEMQTEEYIADVAKSKLGLVKEDEILFKPEK